MSNGWDTHGRAGYLQDSGKPRLMVVHPYLKSKTVINSKKRSPEARLQEAVGLASAIDVDVVAYENIPLGRVTPKTFIGSGKCEELKAYIEAQEIEIVVCDADLSPIQHRNLETALATKVIDRTALILEIFGARASTKEGELQVELAHLTYQKSRLVRSWTHLERQRGGKGFMGGPGERQIESDRRMISDRISLLKKQLTQVTRTRSLQRAKRQKAPYPVIALVGYTNAGKSTLFNMLTHAEVLAEDMLFATLDPTMRAVTLSGGRKVILSDTVGFISELPHMLIAAFRATLEEVLSADIIVHVRDSSHADSNLQKDDVISVLSELGVEMDMEKTKTPILEALNKVDLLDEAERDALNNLMERNPHMYAVSGLTGEGTEGLLTAIDEILSKTNITVEVTVPFNEGAKRAFLYAHGEIEKETASEDGQHYTVTIDPAKWGQFQKMFGFSDGDALEDEEY